MDPQILDVIKTWMEGEINNFIKVWISIFISLIYSYHIIKIIPKGTLRFLTILPVVCLFFNLPLHLHTIHLGGLTAFFIAWLANFKLIMLAFGIGPLSDPSLPFSHFLALSCLPIKIQQQKSDKKGKLRYSINITLKVVSVAVFVRVYDYNEQIHPYIIWFIYCFHIYFCLEVILAIVAALARALIGAELEPQFNEPHLSTSLQDFWGRRWNIMVSRILRPSVYLPVLEISEKFVGRVWAPLPAVFSTFVVSAIMHEIIFFYLGRLRPTWDITWFFLLHGVCLLVEIAIKKAVNYRWRVPQIVSGPLTVGFVVGTGLWLFLPELLRVKGDVRAFEEYAAVGAFVKDLSFALKSTVFGAKHVV